MNVAPRMARLGTESAFEVLARAKALERAGREIIHLEIGEPDFETPRHIRDAAKRALDEGATHYGPAAGLPELREAIAKHVSVTRGVPVSPEEVVVTPGGKPIMFFTILALVNAGDEVIYPSPGFPIYESVVNFVGGVLDRRQLERIAAAAVERGITILTDEIYREFLYEGEFVSMLGFPGVREQ